MGEHQGFCWQPPILFVLLGAPRLAIMGPMVRTDEWAMDAAAVAQWRKAERARLLALRTSIPLSERRRYDALMTGTLLREVTPAKGAVIGFYWPMKGEFDPREAIQRWREAGCVAALPVVVRKLQPMEFREWWPDVPTKPGVFNLPEPQSRVVVPDIVLMPPVGFDAQCYRLGYGAGYFDRTLATLAGPVLKVGVGREVGRIGTIHPQPHDIPMDLVVTEAGVTRAA